MTETSAPGAGADSIFKDLLRDLCGGDDDWLNLLLDPDRQSITRTTWNPDGMLTIERIEPADFYLPSPPKDANEGEK